MSDQPEQSPVTPPEPHEAPGEVRPSVQIQHRQDSFSLSALFLLMVTVAALLVFVSNALPGRKVERQEESSSFVHVTYTNYYLQAQAQQRKMQQFVLRGGLLAIGVLVGGMTGFGLQRRFGSTLLGIIFGAVASTVPAVAVAYPPTWPMVAFSCGSLIAIGLILKAKA